MKVCNNMLGSIHSFQSLGTVDGPGVRFVVFFQGCNLRCGCCHNPDTWDCASGNKFSPEQVVSKALRFKEYFGKSGGITLSGGEPLLQSDFAYEIFTLCHQNSINTCLDTSGSVINSSVKKLLSVTDRVLLDIKYTDNDQYLKYVGTSLDKVLEFLAYLDKHCINVTLRQVIIPSLNDNENNIYKLSQIAKKYSCVKKAELLPFRKVCKVKYDSMKIAFPFEKFPEPSNGSMEKLRSLLNAEINI